MAKTHQVMSFCDLGKEYKVIKKYGDEKPYKIYNLYNDYGRYGYITEHRKLKAEFCTMYECFTWFVQNGIGVM